MSHVVLKLQSTKLQTILDIFFIFNKFQCNVIIILNILNWKTTLRKMVLHAVGIINFHAHTMKCLIESNIQLHTWCIFEYSATYHGNSLSDELIFISHLNAWMLPTSKGWSWVVQLPGKNIAFMVLRNVFFESAPVIKEK